MIVATGAASRKSSTKQILVPAITRCHALEIVRYPRVSMSIQSREGTFGMYLRGSGGPHRSILMSRSPAGRGQSQLGAGDQWRDHRGAG